MRIMIDIKDLRNNPAVYKDACQKKGYSTDIDKILQLDKSVRQMKQQLQEINTEKNQAGKAIATLKDPQEKKSAIEKMSQIKEQEKQIGEKLPENETQLSELLLNVPQPAHPKTPIGKDENDNVEVRRWGEVRQFDFEPKDHTELGEQLKIIDRRGRKILVEVG